MYPTCILCHRVDDAACMGRRYWEGENGSAALLWGKIFVLKWLINGERRSHSALPLPSLEGENTHPSPPLTRSYLRAWWETGMYQLWGEQSKWVWLYKSSIYVYRAFFLVLSILEHIKTDEITFPGLTEFFLSIANSPMVYYSDCFMTHPTRSPPPLSS